MKSVYSYLQYHWWPIVFTVREGFLTSSVMYKIRRDGKARTKRISAGRIVHTVSIVWASKMYRLTYLLDMSAIRAYPTTVSTKVRIIRVWSWKEMSCIITEDAAS